MIKQEGGNFIPPGDKPTLKELDCFTYISSSGTEHKIYIINAVATRWRSLGLALGFEGYELDIIKINHPDQVEMRSHEVFAQWLTQKCSKTATWETLLQAMKKARCGTVAEQVRKALIGCVEGNSMLTHNYTHVQAFYLYY